MINYCKTPRLHWTELCFGISISHVQSAGQQQTSDIPQRWHATPIPRIAYTVSHYWMNASLLDHPDWGVNNGADNNIGIILKSHKKSHAPLIKHWIDRDPNVVAPPYSTLCISIHDVFPGKQQVSLTLRQAGHSPFSSVLMRCQQNLHTWDRRRHLNTCTWTALLLVLIKD